jgi:hypothetical protein
MNSIKLAQARVQWRISVLSSVINSGSITKYLTGLYDIFFIHTRVYPKVSGLSR